MSLYLWGDKSEKSWSFYLQCLSSFIRFCYCSTDLLPLKCVEFENICCFFHIDCRFKTRKSTKMIKIVLWDFHPIKTNYSNVTIFISKAKKNQFLKTGINAESWIILHSSFFAHEIITREQDGSNILYVKDINMWNKIFSYINMIILSVGTEGSADSNKNTDMRSNQNSCTCSHFI